MSEPIPPTIAPIPVEPTGDPDLLAFQYPRTVEEIRAGLKAIAEDRGQIDEPSAALRRLKAYRFLCGLPYRDLALDEALSRRAEAAADICLRLGGLTHTPANPGLPEDEYRVARDSAGRCNLAFGTRDLTEAVDLWMDDSDAANIDRLGHRRWCLDPDLTRTGLGRVRNFTAMFVGERGRGPGPEIEAVLYPPAGYLPVEFFAPGAAWSLSLKPGSYRVPDRDRLEVRVYRVESEAIDRAHPLAIEALNVETRGFGVPLCVIFRPKGVEVRPGLGYWAEVTGLERTDGTPTAIRYRVDLVP